MGTTHNHRAIKLKLEYNVTISTPVDFPVDIDKNKLTKAAFEDLTYWEDGRYPLEAELLTHALSLIIKTACDRVVDAHMYGKYKGQVIQHPDGNGASARWCVESAKANKDVYVTVNGEVSSVHIERDPDNDY